MVPFQETRLFDLFERMKTCRVAVLGDLMIDRYIWGDVTRISPEAPVPIVEVTQESARLGGAANVGNNIVSLGGSCFLAGVAGADSNGDALISMTRDLRINPAGIVRDPDRMTTVKTRVIAHQQHVVRIDHEHRHPIGEDVARRLLSSLEDLMPQLDALILEDYNKGVMTETVIRGAIDSANRHGKLIMVDPKLSNFFAYREVTVFKPNLKETSEGLGRKLRTDADVEEAGRELLARLNARHVLITRSEKGMSLFSSDGSVQHVPTRAKHVADVSGAGDTVIATLTMAMAAGASVEEAATLANLAGGYVVGEVGIVPVTPDAILEFGRKVHG
ncbi:MAG: D-glycero-beta-D-manno-heptose-7-phosphate kinase [Bacteroidetes bacterium]|nr:D-glycero-beta-D-manno-heptose-7-phosphate kinase [Bacteroidota bacterium]